MPRTGRRTKQMGLADNNVCACRDDEIRSTGSKIRINNNNNNNNYADFPVVSKKGRGGLQLADKICSSPWRGRRVRTSRFQRHSPINRPPPSGWTKTLLYAARFALLPRYLRGEGEGLLCSPSTIFAKKQFRETATGGKFEFLLGAIFDTLLAHDRLPFSFFGRLFLPSQLNIVKIPIPLLSTSRKNKIRGEYSFRIRAIAISCIFFRVEKIFDTIIYIENPLNGINKTG